MLIFFYPGYIEKLICFLNNKINNTFNVNFRHKWIPSSNNEIDNQFDIYIFFQFKEGKMFFFT